MEARFIEGTHQSNAIKRRFPPSGTDRIGKIFLVGHGYYPQYYFNGRPPSSTDTFDFDVHQGKGNEELLWTVPPLTNESTAFIQQVEAALMPTDDSFEVEMGLICCYAGRDLVDAIVTLLDADNSAVGGGKRYKVRVGGYAHTLLFEATYNKTTNALIRVVLGKEIPPDPNDPDPMASITTTWEKNDTNVATPPSYGVVKQTK